MTYREADDLRQARGLPNKLHRRARRKPAESREQLLRAATKEFVTHGFAGARVNRRQQGSQQSADALPLLRQQIAALCRGS
jgi:hypothetical protein